MATETSAHTTIMIKPIYDQFVKDLKSSDSDIQ